LDIYVELTDIPVLRIRADMKGDGPRAAFDRLESKLPTLKGRRFYGTFQVLEDGEEYFACVELIGTDDPTSMQVERGVIPGGLYARRKLMDWQNKISSLPTLFEEMVGDHDVDPGRPSVEFYRSQKELHLLLPVRSRRL